MQHRHLLVGRKPKRDRSRFLADDTGASGRAGFSAIDALVTMALLTVVTAFAAPRVSDTLRSYWLYCATRVVVGELQSARMTAITTNKRAHFSVVGDHAFRIHTDDDGDGVEDDGEVAVTRALSDEAPTIVLAATGTATFAPDGTAVSGATIRATSPAGTRNVVVGAGGRIRVEKAP